MAYCMSHTIVKYDGEVITIHPLRCRCWTCENCAPWRRMHLIKDAKAGKPRTFITLTSNPNSAPTPAERAQQLVDAWRHIVRTLRARPTFKKMQYLVVMEKTERGEPHLHILARMPYLKQKWLSDEMRKLTNAPIVDIRTIKSSDAATRYVTKYVGKDPHRYEGCKRYWKSRDYMHPTRAEIKAQSDPDVEYFYIDGTYKTYRETLIKTGWHIAADTYNTMIVHGPPEVMQPPGCKSNRWRQ